MCGIRGIDTKNQGGVLHKELVASFQIGYDTPVLALGGAEIRLAHIRDVRTGGQGTRKHFQHILGESAKAVAKQNPSLRAGRHVIAVGVEVGFYAIDAGKSKWCI